MALKLGLAYLPSNLKYVAVADGKSVPILGMVQIPIQFGPSLLPITAYVLPTFLSHLDLIFGESSMIEHGVTLQYGPVQCIIKSKLPEGEDVILDNTTGIYKSFYLPSSKPATCMAVEDHIGLPNQVSVKTALRCLRSHRERCFIAIIRPTLITPSGPMCAAAHASEEQSPPQPDLSGAPPEYREALQRLIDEFPDIFSETPQAGGALVDPSLVNHTIKLKPGTKPPFRRNHRLSPLEMAELKERVAEFLEKGIISPTNSPYGAPVLFVPKPSGTGLRFCLDYRLLN
jgi:hypothetical protein